MLGYFKRLKVKPTLARWRWTVQPVRKQEGHGSRWWRSNKKKTQANNIVLFFFLFSSSGIEFCVYVRSSRVFQLLLHPKWLFFVIIIFCHCPSVNRGGKRTNILEWQQLYITQDLIQCKLYYGLVNLP